MNGRRQFGYTKRSGLSFGVTGLICSLCLWPSACQSPQHERIAVIPQVDGETLWEPAHVGAEYAAVQAGVSVYWNAPTNADDVQAQIRLVNKVVDRNYQGLVLAPDRSLALITHVYRALAQGIPKVIIGSPLAIPAGGSLLYILNDDAEGGQIAAQRVAGLLKGHGTVALLGINPNIAGILIRARSFEQFLAQNDPGIHIVDKRLGSFNIAHERQAAIDSLNANPDLDVVVALTGDTFIGTFSALGTRRENHSIRVVALDSLDLGGFSSEWLDSVIREDTRLMGQQAVELIHARLLGQAVPAIVHLHPKLITRENFSTPEVQRMISMDWTLGRWRWSFK
jgi:ribose transport system substrate-binding protein